MSEHEPISIRPIDVYSAAALINYHARRTMPKELALRQLEGAVALHNMLAQSPVAYLADEVGQGKTYVALGVVGLLRHFHRNLRVLYIAPRENIQTKWYKEIRNFTVNNWKIRDLRVRSLQDTPAVEVHRCRNLADLVRSAHMNDQRDFLVRLTSLSFPLSNQGNKDQWRAKRDVIRDLMPWLPTEAFHLYDKDAFKQAYAHAVNAALPRFDLLVLDEGHNLKHGWRHTAHVAARNKILGTLLGSDNGAKPPFPGCGRKVDRVLILSATPLEGDYKELYNQLDVLGVSEHASILADSEADPEDQKAFAKTFLIRRITELEVNGQRHTKNMYRREWRAGGMEQHRQPLQLADPRQRLIVALIQKKVAEILAETGKEQGRKFGRSFQVGMLSSFESFFQTAKVKSAGDDSTFDQSDQTEDQAEKEGIDTPTLNAVIQSYKRKFRAPLPHPKMDAVARTLWRDLRAGEKSLVFVRRVASVWELKDKVTESYDAWLYEYLCSGLPTELQPKFEAIYQAYRDEHLALRPSQKIQLPTDEREEHRDHDETEDESVGFADALDTGGKDTFFSWFFRGEPHKEILTGATFRKNRLDSEGSVFSLFFEDNHVAWLLKANGDPREALATATGLAADALDTLLQKEAYKAFTHHSKAQKYPRQRMFRAYQEAALELLKKHAQGNIKDKAAIILDAWYRAPGKKDDQEPPANFPGPGTLLGAATFFSKLRNRPLLRWRIWPRLKHKDFRDQFLERERRRELISSCISLGHPSIDLWRLSVSQIGTLEVGAGRQTEEAVEELIDDFLTLLESQIDEPGLQSLTELERIGRHFDLIVDVNFPEFRDKSLNELRRYYGASLARQTPVGGMAGGVNGQLVKQFRMPGYPYVLITTDVLQEGEDLHTFASRVVHYGISWTPSSMEQRTGRLDRIGSQTHRRLVRGQSDCENHKLQVYYPYLADTVELLQVHAIFRKMNHFIEMLHQDLVCRERVDSTLNASCEFLRALADCQPPEGELQSAFDIEKWWLVGDPRQPAVTADAAEVLTGHFKELTDKLERYFRIEWVDREGITFSRLGSCWVLGTELLPAGQDKDTTRVQPFSISLRSMAGGHLLVRVESPIGAIHIDDEEKIEAAFAIQQRFPGARIAAKLNRYKQYDLSAIADILFAKETTQFEEVMDVLKRGAVLADVVEKELLDVDMPIENFKGLGAEVEDA